MEAQNWKGRWITILQWLWECRSWCKAYWIPCVLYLYQTYRNDYNRQSDTDFIKRKTRLMLLQNLKVNNSRCLLWLSIVYPSKQDKFNRILMKENMSKFIQDENMSSRVLFFNLSNYFWTHLHFFNFFCFLNIFKSIKVTTFPITPTNDATSTCKVLDMDTGFYTCLERI